MKGIGSEHLLTRACLFSILIKYIEEIFKEFQLHWGGGGSFGNSESPAPQTNKMCQMQKMMSLVNFSFSYISLQQTQIHRALSINQALSVKHFVYNPKGFHWCTDLELRHV